jgi:hypothetical protein
MMMTEGVSKGRKIEPDQLLGCGTNDDVPTGISVLFALGSTGKCRIEQIRERPHRELSTILSVSV